MISGGVQENFIDLFHGSEYGIAEMDYTVSRYGFYKKCVFYRYPFTTTSGPTHRPTLFLRFNPIDGTVFGVSALISLSGDNVKINEEIVLIIGSTIKGVPSNLRATEFFFLRWRVGHEDEEMRLRSC
ncbi:hypothetical protein OUZ56_002702 [Daphnia magna]|uniref:Uncharacterized protein n=1 Tax=Daphnia magna TaxID=35525 RepID=A0ABR0A6H7_9CRUS|nr:hypothetical protein OUZ56_002702 [Daphnia magna]